MFHSIGHLVVCFWRSLNYVTKGSGRNLPANPVSNDGAHYPMEIFLQQCIIGLSIASVIALVAVGITLIFGLTGIVNFAQGEMLMLGGYTVWFVMSQIGIGNGFGIYILGLALGILLVGAFGYE